MAYKCLVADYTTTISTTIFTPRQPVHYQLNTWINVNSGVFRDKHISSYRLLLFCLPKKVTKKGHFAQCCPAHG